MMMMMCCHDGIIVSWWCKGLNESCKTEELYAAAEGYRYRLHLVDVVDLSYYVVSIDSIDPIVVCFKQ